jgi:hypothetical protein
VNHHYEYADPRFGFEFGAARVTRMAHIDGRYHVMCIDTPTRHVQVAVSPTGRSVRVWMDGREAAWDEEKE